jgi:hypothetical protein
MSRLNVQLISSARIVPVFAAAINPQNEPINKSFSVCRKSAKLAPASLKRPMHLSQRVDFPL